MEIAMIEDEQIHRELLSSYIQSWGREKGEAIVIRQYENAASFLFHWEEIQPDILFVDIQMPGMNGMDLAKEIRKQNEKVFLVFTTGISDYIEEGYEVQAMHYLLKPINQEKLRACLDRACSKRPSKEYLMLHSQLDEVVKIEIEQINAIEAQKHMSLIHMANEKTCLVKESLSELENTLKEHHFVKCHRSYLCRLGSIHKIGKDTIFLMTKARCQSADECIRR